MRRRDFVASSFGALAAVAGGAAALDNRIHIAGGTVQSAIVPLPKGLSFDTDSHEAFEVAP